MDENRDEVYLLFHTARTYGQRPSYYAFGAALPLQAQYEIDAFITMIGTQYETEIKEEVSEQRAASKDP